MASQPGMEARMRGIGPFGLFGDDYRRYREPVAMLLPKLF